MQRFTNIMDGPSLLVPVGSDLDTVPSPFVELITDEHRAAFQNTSEYFANIASECRIDKMREWLDLLAKSEKCELEINISDMAGNAVIAKVGGFKIEPRKPVDLPAIAKGLDHLYSLIHATYHEGFAAAGGIHEPRTVSDYGLLIESDIAIPDDAVAFFTTSCGDSVLALNDNAYWYSHETHKVVDAGSIHDALSNYFGFFVQRKYWDFEFPY